MGLEVGSRTPFGGEFGHKLRGKLLALGSVYMFFTVYIYIIYTCFLTWGGTPGTVRVFSPESYVHDKSVFLGVSFYMEMWATTILSYVHIYTLST